MFNKKKLPSTLVITTLLYACSSVDSGSAFTPKENPKVPAEAFDLSQWKITIPLDLDRNGKVDEVTVSDIQSYSHPDFFYLNEDNHLVFTSPNKAATTATSTNTRSELRQMLRGTNTKIKTKGPKNNFVVASHPKSSEYGSIGGNLAATLKVDHVSRNAQITTAKPAYSVVVGQIHAGKSDLQSQGFGYGNEPLKIYYKKLPNHEYGSVFWTYERNLEKENKDRTDLAYPVWGNTWTNLEEPEVGIKLGEVFSYEVNVYNDIMYLTFKTENHPDVTYEINLADNVDAYGNVDKKDHPLGYLGDYHYFKAGAYNQCSTSTKKGFWYPKCAGTGDWKTDKANGDYVQVTFLSLTQGPAKVPTTK